MPASPPNHFTLDGNARLGIRLFILYAAFYLAFVLVNAFAPQLGEWQVWGGLNLAVLWGFALIGLAFVLSLAYGCLCVSEESNPHSDNSHATLASTQKSSLDESRETESN